MNFVRPPEFRLTKASLHRQAENLLHKRKGRPTHPLVEGVPARKAWMTCDDLCCVKCSIFPKQWSDPNQICARDILGKRQPQVM